MPRIARVTLRVLTILLALLASILVTTEAHAAGPVSTLPGKVSFGSIHVGKTATQSLTLYVAAGQTITHLQSTDGAPFEVPTVPANCSVPGPTQCTIKVSFSPIQPGAAAGSIWIVTCSSSTSCSNTYVPATGTGVAPGTSPAIAFGSVKAGVRVTKPFTVRFDAGWFVRYADFLNQPGPATATFTVPGVPPGTYTDPCGTSPTATSCTMTGAFRPRSVGAQSDTMRVHVCKVADFSFCTVLTSTVSGTGTNPAAISPTSLSFGQVLVSSSSTRTVNVTLDAGWHLTSVGFSSVPSVPNPISDFRYLNTKCSSSTECNVQFSFQPTQPGNYAADAYLGACNTDNICLDLSTYRITGTGFQYASKTALKSSASTVALGSPVTFTASVTSYPHGYTTYAGKVTFYDGKTVLCANVPVNFAGVASCTVTAAGATGTHALKAAYSAGTALKPSTSPLIYVKFTA